MNISPEWREHLRAAGRKGGLARSTRKARSSRRNGKKRKAGAPPLMGAIPPF